VCIDIACYKTNLLKIYKHHHEPICSQVLDYFGKILSTQADIIDGTNRHHQLKSWIACLRCFQLFGFCHMYKLSLNSASISMPGPSVIHISCQSIHKCRCKPAVQCVAANRHINVNDETESRSPTTMISPHPENASAMLMLVDLRRWQHDGKTKHKRKDTNIKLESGQPPDISIAKAKFSSSQQWTCVVEVLCRRSCKLRTGREPFK